MVSENASEAEGTIASPEDLARAPQAGTPQPDTPEADTPQPGAPQASPPAGGEAQSASPAPLHALGSAVRRWNSYWIDPIDATGMVLARTLLGIALIYWTLSEVPGVGDFFGPDGLDPNPAIPWYHITVMRFLPRSIAPWVVIVAMLVAATMFIIGRFSRIASLIPWLGVISMYHQNRLVWNGGDDLLRIVCLLVGLWAIAGPTAAVETRIDSLWRGAAPRTRAWGIRLLRIQLFVVYWSTLFEKLRGATWSGGTATFRALGLKNMLRFPAPGFLAHNAVLHNLITWATLLLELVIPLGLISPKWRRKAALAGFLLHASIEYALRVGIFSWVMMVCYLSFFDANDVAIIKAMWQRFWGRVRSQPRPAEVG